MEKKTAKPTAKIDAYEQFFEMISPEDFFNFGLKKFISAEINKARDAWNELLSRIDEKDSDLYIRAFGKGGCRNNEMEEMYRKVFGINIKIDSGNNTEPTKTIENLTGYKKKKNISNYQVSHVFGMATNVYCFTAPWNIVFMPKLLDPFTDNETKGEYAIAFRKRFRAKIIKKFKYEIEEYNRRIKKILPKIKKWVKTNIEESKREDILKNFNPIEIA
ncbi:MAG: hypothetical protein FWB90_09090 [Fibromonadales bacterium]|nr:hypothetical protein [Fibromonadales bacterium]